jgi:hypothetical protein
MGQNLGRIFHDGRITTAYIFAVNLEQPVFLCMKPVKTHFIVYPQENQDGAGHSGRETKYIDHGKNPVSLQITICYYEEIFYHVFRLKA